MAAVDLRPLHRLDPAVSAVLAKAKHVATYKLRRLADGTEEWEREETEGVLFLCRRDAQPRYALCILNRLNTTDFFETVSLPHCEFDFNDRFILFRKRADVRAIWVSPERDDDGVDGLEACRQTLGNIMRELDATPQEATFVSRGSAESNSGPMSKDELRDALFRLLNNDKVLDSLHAQFLATEARKQVSNASAFPLAPQPGGAQPGGAQPQQTWSPGPGNYPPRLPPSSPFGPRGHPFSAYPAARPFVPPHRSANW